MCIGPLIGGVAVRSTVEEPPFLYRLSPKEFTNTHFDVFIHISPNGWK